MTTLFPGANDSFTEPAAPSSTPLDDAGGSGRTHDVSHADLGDAIMAMQAEATMLVHSHDGVTARYGSKLTQANTHQNVDTDSGDSAIHHTIGTGANQGAAGDHTHSVATVWPVGAIFITEVAGNPASAPHNLPGTWTQITGTFLVAAGTTYTAGSTGGSTSHNHDATFNSTGSHSHTSASTSSAGSHSHTCGDTGYSTFGHTHSSSTSSSVSSSVATTSLDYYSYTTSATSHTHVSEGANTTSHKHDVGSTGTGGSHSHTVPGTTSTGSHAHTSTIDSASNINLPPYLVVYVWYRSA